LILQQFTAKEVVYAGQIELIIQQFTAKEVVYAGQIKLILQQFTAKVVVYAGQIEGRHESRLLITPRRCLKARKMGIVLQSARCNELLLIAPFLMYPMRHCCRCRGTR
jgi:hypothetical protein